MTMLAYQKDTRIKIEKLIKEHVNKARRGYPWNGEHEDVVDKIIKIFRKNA
jgi:hypothetical protein